MGSRFASLSHETEVADQYHQSQKLQGLPSHHSNHLSTRPCAKHMSSFKISDDAPRVLYESLQCTMHETIVHMPLHGDVNEANDARTTPSCSSDHELRDQDGRSLEAQAVIDNQSPRMIHRAQAAGTSSDSEPSSAILLRVRCTTRFRYVR